MTNAQSKHITKRTHYPEGKALRKLFASSTYHRRHDGHFRDTMDELYERRWLPRSAAPSNASATSVVGDLYTVPKYFMQRL